jgi:ABC-2 type transport system ATP-binding protein
VRGGSRGGTFFLSSHTLGEVEQVANRVGIIRSGEIAVVEDVPTLKARALRRMEIHFAQPVATTDFEHLPGVTVDRNEHAVMSLHVAGSVDAVIKAAARHDVVNLVSHEPDLEEIFLDYFQPGG